MATNNDVHHHRPIRSFVRREGRLTESQRQALETLLPDYGLPADNRALDLAAAFGRCAPVVLEVGFGNGESLAAMAAAHPERDFLGVEVHRPGVGRLLNRVAAEGLSNIRVIEHDAVEVMRYQLPEACLAGIQLFFPDPWPKKRHHKRRIVQPDWVALAASRLQPDGWLHMATDWEDYAWHMLDVMEASRAFENTAGAGRFAADAGERPRTKFEDRGTRKGHAVYDLVYRRRANASPDHSNT